MDSSRGVSERLLQEMVEAEATAQIGVGVERSRFHSDRLPQRDSPRSVDGLVKALGSDTGIWKSEVSRIYGDLDERFGSRARRPGAEAGECCFWAGAAFGCASAPIRDHLGSWVKGTGRWPAAGGT